jgi:hypothetical protein
MPILSYPTAFQRFFTLVEKLIFLACLIKGCENIKTRFPIVGHKNCDSMLGTTEASLGAQDQKQLTAFCLFCSKSILLPIKIIVRKKNSAMDFQMSSTCYLTLPIYYPKGLFKHLELLSIMLKFKRDHIY